MSVNLERRSGPERRHLNMGAPTGKERRGSAEQRAPEFDEMFFSDVDIDSASVKPAPKVGATMTEETMDLQDRIRN